MKRQLENVSLVPLMWDVSLDKFRFGSFAWKLLLGYSALKRSIIIFRQELYLGNFRSGTFAW